MNRRAFTMLLPAMALGFKLDAADMSLTVDQLTAFIRSSAQLKQPDKQVAEYLKHVKLVYKLDDRTIEELQGLGAGPKTVAALRDLRDSSAGLPVPPAPVVTPKPEPIPGPNSIEQKKIVDEVRTYALNYSKQLPDFICLQVTRRYIDYKRDYWRLADTVTARLSYFGQKEDYKVVLVNNQAITTDMSIEQLGGTTSAGEFGSMMRDIFLPESEARFEWERWATLRGKRMYVFSYDVQQPRSRYHIMVEKTLDIVPAYRGLIYVDHDNNMVSRITMEPYDIPLTFPVQAVKTILDYDLQKIGSNDYMLPLKAVVSSRTARYNTKNDVEFRMYRKFGTETTIKFDTPEPLPEDKLKEKP